jgi:capsular polysaccharide biosynthesis protein
MGNNSADFMNNRSKVFKEQYNYWSNNLESGILRFLERVLLGFNVSDVLAGNLGQVQHLDEVKRQVKERKFLEGSIVQLPPDDSLGLSADATSAQYFFHFKKAKVDILTGLVVLDAGFVVDSTLAKWQKVIFRGGIGSSIKRTKRASFQLHGSYVILPHSPFYYHTVIDELPNLIRIREYKSDCRNVVVHSLAPQWAIELLEYFDFNVTKLDKKSAIIENFFSISAPRTVVQKNLELLRGSLNTNPTRILVVSRKGAPRSDNLIESAIVSQFPDSELLDPGDYSIAEQIQLFSEAKLVIGLHGGALTNVVWMGASGRLVEVFNHAYRTTDYQTVCAELGIGYIAIDAVDMDPNQVALVVKRQVDDL